MTDVRDALFLSFIPPFSHEQNASKRHLRLRASRLYHAKIQKGGHDGLDDTRFG